MLTLPLQVPLSLLYGKTSLFVNVRVHLVHLVLFALGHQSWVIP
jgi:hypothetical protein